MSEILVALVVVVAVFGGAIALAIEYPVFGYILAVIVAITIIIVIAMIVNGKKEKNYRKKRAMESKRCTEEAERRRQARAWQEQIRVTESNKNLQTMTDNRMATMKLDQPNQNKTLAKEPKTNVIAQPNIDNKNKDADKNNGGDNHTNKQSADIDTNIKYSHEQDRIIAPACVGRYSFEIAATGEMICSELKKCPNIWRDIENHFVHNISRIDVSDHMYTNEIRVFVCNILPKLIECANSNLNIRDFYYYCEIHCVRYQLERQVLEFAVRVLEKDNFALKEYQLQKQQEEERKRQKEEQKKEEEKRKKEEEINKLRKKLKKPEPQAKGILIVKKTSYKNEEEKRLNESLYNYIEEVNKKIEKQSHYDWLVERQKLQIKAKIKANERIKQEELDAAKEEIDVYAKSSEKKKYQPISYKNDNITYDNIKKAKVILFKDIKEKKSKNVLFDFFKKIDIVVVSLNMAIAFGELYCVLFNYNDKNDTYGQLQLVEYKNISVKVDSKIVKESQYYELNKDDEIYKKHYLHENKDGSPDKRFDSHYNYSWYEVYRGIVILSCQGSNLKLEFSNRKKANDYAKIMKEFIDLHYDNEIEDFTNELLKTPGDKLSKDEIIEKAQVEIDKRKERQKIERAKQKEREEKEKLEREKALAEMKEKARIEEEQKQKEILQLNYVDALLGKEVIIGDEIISKEDAIKNILESGIVFYYATKKYDGKCNFVNNKYILLKDSRLSTEISVSGEGRADELRRLYSQYISDEYMLMEDIEFDNASAAAVFLTGTGVSGKSCWRTKNGITLGEILDKLPNVRKQEKQKKKSRTHWQSDFNLSNEELSMILQMRKEKQTQAKIEEDKKKEYASNIALMEIGNAPIQPTSNNRTITNNIFSITFKQVEKCSENCMAVFVNSDGEEISNRVEYGVKEIDEEFKLSFELLSQKQFDNTKKYYLFIKDSTSEKVLGKIEYKINISFASDFDF